MVGAEDERKELRVRIEPIYHQKLIALKMLRNKNMTDAIHEALAHYFANVLVEGPSAREEAGAPKVEGIGMPAALKDPDRLLP